MTGRNRIPGDRKREIARGWEESGLLLKDYAELHRINERTLRSWRAIYCRDDTPPSVERVRFEIRKAMATLQRLLDSLQDEDGGSAAEPVTVEPILAAPGEDESAVENPVGVLGAGTQRATVENDFRPNQKFDWNT